MQRVIKFRAWDAESNQMIPYEDMLLWDHDVLSSFVMPLRGKNIYMQFTGLLDKNGREIYEGDIVQVWRDSPNYYTVIYSEDEGAFKRKTVIYPHGSYLMEKNPNFVSVIGNVYENPDLFNQNILKRDDGGSDNKTVGCTIAPITLPPHTTFIKPRLLLDGGSDV